MHFWIDKPAGRNYGFGGRRYPCASSASKARSGQRGRRGREIGPMVTPVHRFQSLNGPSSVHSSCTPGPSVLGYRAQQQSEAVHRPQPSIPHFVGSDESSRSVTADCGIPVFRTSHSSIVISNNVTNATVGGAGGTSSNNERPVLPNETTNNGFNGAAGFLDFSEISDTELAGYRLRCGVWITFVLATGFVSVAKFYFGNRDAGLDMLIFCGLLFTLLLSGCFYSTLFRRSRNNHRHQQEHLEPAEEQDIATLAAAMTIREENDQHAMQQQLNIGLQQQQLQLQQQQQPPPPPYHIAILIPPANSPEEAPPPSYDKAINEDPAPSHTRILIFSKDDEN